MVCGLAIENIMAQQPSTTHWFNVQLPVVFNDRWQWWNEASYRTYGETLRLNQYFIRTGARYSFNDCWEVAASFDKFYRKVVARKDDHELGEETRLWQEVSLQTPLKNKFYLQNRLRIEERFIEKTSKAASYNAVRFRYRLGVIKELSYKWSIQLTEEILEQLSRGEIGFNLNRISIGGTCQFNSTLQLQGTYFWSRSGVLSQHIFSMVFQKKILVHPKKKNSA
jgi:hypothetical protein